MKEVFRLPGWQGSERSPCCWMCTATHGTRKDCTLSAPWRAGRLSHYDLLIMWRRAGVVPSSIVSALFFRKDIFQFDWLRVMDLGVACDFLGNLFVLLLRHLGGTRKEQVKTLYRNMVDFYKRSWRGFEWIIQTSSLAHLAS